MFVCVLVRRPFHVNGHDVYTKIRINFVFYCSAESFRFVSVHGKVVDENQNKIQIHLQHTERSQLFVVATLALYSVSLVLIAQIEFNKYNIIEVNLVLLPSGIEEKRMAEHLIVLKS